MRVGAGLDQAEAGERSGNGLGEHRGPISIVAERETPKTPPNYFAITVTRGPRSKEVGYGCVEGVDSQYHP